MIVLLAAGFVASIVFSAIQTYEKLDGPGQALSELRQPRTAAGPCAELASATSARREHFSRELGPQDAVALRRRPAPAATDQEPLPGL